MSGSEQILKWRSWVQGLKISLKEGPVPDVTENDSHILQLHWTMERLQQQHNVLDQRIARLGSLHFRYIGGYPIQIGMGQCIEVAYIFSILFD